MQVNVIKAVLLCCGLLGAGCRIGGQWNFQGYVYDAITGERLTGYTLEAKYPERTLAAKVAADGLYSIVLPPDNAFIVTIKAPAHRDLVAQQNRLALSDTPSGAPTVYFRNAVLFPLEPQAPQTTFNVVVAGSTERPSGKLRLELAPLGGGAPDISLNVGSLPLTSPDRWVDSSLWEDAVIELDVVDGVATLPAGAALYGANYNVAVYDVPGYRSFFTTTQYRVGVSATNLETITLQTYAPNFVLQAVSASNRFGDIDPAGTLVITFNAPIEFDPASTPAAMQEAVDRGTSFTQLQSNGPITPGVLKDATPPGIQVASVTIDGPTLTLTFTGASAFTTVPVPGVASVSYPLADVRVRPQGRSIAPVSVQAIAPGVSGVVTLAAQPPP